jgi:hypothetical protein
MVALPLSIPPVTLRNSGRPYHETGKNPGIVTILHNPPPIDSPVPQWTIGALARGAKERETLRPWRETLRSARRWIFSARCYLARGARKLARDANAKDLARDATCAYAPARIKPY